MVRTGTGVWKIGTPEPLEQAENKTGINCQTGNESRLDRRQSTFDPSLAGSGCAICPGLHNYGSESGRKTSACG